MLSAGIRRAGGFHGSQVDAEVAQPVEQPVQVRPVADFAGEHGLAVPGFEHHPAEGGFETLAQPPTQDNPAAYAGQCGICRRSRGQLPPLARSAAPATAGAA